MLGSVNVRSIRNKGPLLSDTVASHAFDFLCLTETQIRTTDSDSFLRSLTRDGFSLIHKPCSTGIGGGVGFFIRESYKYRKVDTSNYSSFENIVISVSVPGRTLLLASIYHPPRLCSSIFLDEFMSFVLFLLSSVDGNYFICGHFNIHVDVPCADNYKSESLLESCKLTQLTIPLICTVICLISFFPPVIKICACMLTSVKSYLTMQSLNVLLTFLPLLLTAKQEFPIEGIII